MLFNLFKTGFKYYIFGGETLLNIKDLNSIELEMDIKITRYSTLDLLIPYFDFIEVKDMPFFLS